MSDLPRALRFYRDILGLKLLVESAGSALFDCGPVRLLLLTAREPARGGSPGVIYFDVQDIEAEHERLANTGVVFDGPPHLLAHRPDHELWTASFRDPDGQGLALLCRKH